MLQITKFETQLFGANCYVISSPESNKVLVVDPGLGAANLVVQYLQGSDKTVGAVLLTHGHVDHVWESALVESTYGAPVFIPGPDRYMLEDPLGLLGMSPMNVDWIKPADIHDVPEGDWEALPGIVLRMVPAPGHSPGSSVFLIGDELSDRGGVSAKSALTGDVIFAGSVGRTDLPGGDDAVMQASLRTLKYALDPETKLFPGHGPATTWASELDVNPYVRNAR